MARGKFNKRGGGKRVDAQSAQEIEQRNQRLAEFEEERTRRRAEAEEEEAGGEEGEDGDAEKESGTDKPKEPVKVTSEEDHRRNLAKLHAVKKRREEAEKKRLEAEAAEKALEEERKAKTAALRADESDEESDDDDAKKKKKKKGKDKDLPKLSKIEIKKMKPAQMKEALKERGLEIQGNAKELTQRLIDYEEAR